MKKTKLLAAIGGFGLAVLAVFLIAADHIDAPAVAGTTSDIADFYAFEGDNPNNTVLIATLQGPLEPGTVTNNAQFDEDVLVEFNIDRTGDFVEDLVIQAIKRGDSMYFFGPVGPTQTGLSSIVETSVAPTAVKISTSADVQTATNNGMTFFAGPRRDAFFFDFNRFNMVASGSVAPEGFLPPGQADDFFDNLNVLAIVVEVPNSLLGTAPTHVAVAAGLFPPGALPNAYNVWVTTKRKQ
ncbi:MULTISPECIES: DUF4331 family protein [Altibacter]|uniref:DUF4331 family protein n=1 Tax=Altibacter TaxID=1535231 RepID=UPI000551B9AB|nr:MULTISPECIES: DUF4331 family protein [Altibacter]MCW8982103.1 DUF4331 domain-containing protein [Altibacter sp.]MCW9037749.1 DUF4331 domain-containing protein [Altibacter sp.]